MANPIVPWLGGKRRLAKQIIPLIPEHTCYCEPFAGGAAVFFHRPNASKVEVLNDINGELTNLYRVIQHHLEEFVRQFKWALSSRQVFEWHKAVKTETLTDIQRAARFYYLQKMCFGGKATSQVFGTATTAPPKLNILRLEEQLSEAHLRLARVYIEHEPWQKVISRYDRSHTFFYIDPPYWQTAGYGVAFEWSEYEELAVMFGSMKGKAIISLNDHPAIRELFNGFRMETADIKYTCGLGKPDPSKELLIFNWDIGE